MNAYFSHLAAYKQWMNRKLYDAAAGGLRAALDETIIAFCAEAGPSVLDEMLEWTSRNGVNNRKAMGDVLLHVFNHQTHHRGQATTQFS